MPWLKKWVTPPVVVYDTDTERAVFLAYHDNDFYKPAGAPFFSLRKERTDGTTDEDYVMIDFRRTKAWQDMTLSLEDRLIQFLRSPEYWSALFDGGACPWCGSEDILELFEPEDKELAVSRIVCRNPDCKIEWLPSEEHYTAWEDECNG